MKFGKDTFWGAPDKERTQFALAQHSKRTVKPLISMFQRGYSKKV